MRELVRSCRAGTGDPLTNHVVESLPWLAKRTMAEFASRSAERNGAVQTQRAAEAAATFHARAGVPLRQVDLNPVRPVVRLAHQPNALAYGRLLFQFVGLSVLHRSQDASPLYVFLDYDTCSDDKFARTHLPDPLRDTGLMPIGLTRQCIPHRSDLALHAPPPPQAWVEHVERLARVSLHACAAPNVPAAEALAVRDRLEVLLADLAYACDHGNSLADACAIFLCRVVNLRMHLDIRFCPASLVWQSVPNSVVASLIDGWPDMHARITGWAQKLAREISGFTPSSVVPSRPELLPVWWRCDCGTRVAIEATVATRGFAGTCARCARSIGGRLSELSPATTIPRVVAHNALNTAGFGYSGGVNHLGSADHVVTHALGLTDAGWEVLPQALWQPAGDFDTWVERSASEQASPYWTQAASHIRDGSVSLLHYLAAWDPQALAEVAAMQLSSNELDAPWQLGRA